MICCLMEAAVATPYRLAWQELLNCELRGDGISARVIPIKELDRTWKHRPVDGGGLNIFCCNWIVIILHLITQFLIQVCKPILKEVFTFF